MSTVLSPGADDQQHRTTRGGPSPARSGRLPHTITADSPSVNRVSPPVQVVFLPPDLLYSGGPLRAAGALRALIEVPGRPPSRGRRDGA